MIKSYLQKTVIPLSIGLSQFGFADCTEPKDFLTKTNEGELIGCEVPELSQSTVTRTAKLYLANGQTTSSNEEVLKSMEKLVIIVDGLDNAENEDGKQAIEVTAEHIASEGKYSVLTYDYGINLSQLGNIQYNGSVLASFLADVNNMRNDHPPAALVGYSLGGVLGRYALATMENNNIDHGISLFVSYEAPHKGVYIPQGIQNILPVYSYYTGTVLGGINKVLKDAGLKLHIDAFGTTIDNLAKGNEALIQGITGITFTSSNRQTNAYG